MHVRITCYEIQIIKVERNFNSAQNFGHFRKILILEKFQAVLEFWFYLPLLGKLESLKSFHFFAQNFWVLWKNSYGIIEICVVGKF
jgi:hypothetical protein